jgi:hypothetical protein
VANPDDITFADNWLGSYYQLAMLIGPQDDDTTEDRLRSALRATWRDPTLDGCYLDRWMELETQQRVSPENLSVEHGAAYGWANTPLGRLVCATHIVRESSAPGRTWVDLCLPVGALGDVEPRLEFPIGGEASRSWREPLDEWFAGIARGVARDATFQIAFIGEEVSGIGELALSSEADRRVSVVTVAAHGIEWTPPDRW